jgi:hypothetical protein
MLTADFMQQLICKRREDGQASFAPVGVESQSMVDTSQQLCQIISLMGEQTPTKKAKAAGVMGAEIWVKAGDILPTGRSELTFLGLDINLPDMGKYTGAQTGKKAHHMPRWVNTRGDKGPWGETASATITG